MWTTLFWEAGAVKECRHESALGPAVKVLLFRDRQDTNKNDAQSHATWRILWNMLTFILSPGALFYLRRLEGTIRDKLMKDGVTFFILYCISVLFGTTFTCMLHHLCPAHFLCFFVFHIIFVTLCFSFDILSCLSLSSLIMSSAQCLFLPIQ